MKPHFYNPIPSDFNEKKIDFFPYDYDPDEEKPKRWNEKKRTDSDTYINSWEGNNILDEGDLDKLQTTYDHLFVEMDNEWENTAKSPSYSYERDGRDGELLASHSCIYDKQDSTFQLRDNSFLRLYRVDINTLKIGDQNYIEIDGNKLKNLKPSDYSKSQTSEIIIKNCSGLKSIKGLRNCTVNIIDCDISNLIIENNENCEFYVKNGTNNKNGFISQNVKCLIEVENVTTTPSNSFVSNSDLMVRSKANNHVNSGKVWKSNKGTVGECYDCNHSGNDWVHWGDTDCDMWYEGLTASTRHGMAMYNSKAYVMNGSDAGLAHYCHRGKRFHVTYDNSIVRGEENFKLQDSRVFINNTDGVSAGVPNFNVKSCDILLSNSKFTVSGADNIKSEDSYVDTLYTKLECSGGSNNIKGKNTFVTQRRESEYNNSSNANIELTGGSLKSEDSKMKAITNNVKFTNLDSLKVLRSKLDSQTKNVEGSGSKWVELIKNNIKSTDTNFIMSDFGDGYIAENNLQATNKNYSIVGSKLSRLHVHKNEFIENQESTIDNFNLAELYFNNYLTPLGTSYSNCNNLKLRKNNHQGKFSIENCKAYIEEVSVQKDAEMTNVNGRMIKNSFIKNLNISDSDLSMDGDSITLNLDVSKSNLRSKNVSVGISFLLSDCIYELLDVTIGNSLSASNCVGEKINVSASSGISCEGDSKLINCSASTVDLSGTGVLNNVSGQVSIDGNFIVYNTSTVTNASGVITSENSTITSVDGSMLSANSDVSSLKGVGVLKGCNPSVDGIQMIDPGGDTEIHSSKSHVSKSDVFYHTKAPMIDHN